MTRSQLILDLLSERGPLTAANVFYALSSDCQERSSKMTLSSLSGTLKKMTDEGLIKRVKNFGPRQGYGYYLTRKT